MKTDSRVRPLLLFDGDCAFCRRSAAWLKQQDAQGVFEYQPFQDAEISPALRASCEKAVHVITREGQILRAGRSVLFVLRVTKWRRVARLLELRPLIWGVEIVYAIVANNRMFFSRFF